MALPPRAQEIWHISIKAAVARRGPMTECLSEEICLAMSTRNPATQQSTEVVRRRNKRARARGRLSIVPKSLKILGILKRMKAWRYLSAAEKRRRPYIEAPCQSAICDSRACRIMASASKNIWRRGISIEGAQNIEIVGRAFILWQKGDENNGLWRRRRRIDGIGGNSRNMSYGVYKFFAICQHRETRVSTFC